MASGDGNYRYRSHGRYEQQGYQYPTHGDYDHTAQHAPPANRADAWTQYPGQQHVPTYTPQQVTYQPVAHLPVPAPLLPSSSHETESKRLKVEEGASLARPSTGPELMTIEDPLYLRQQIIDNSIALIQILCPATYGPHSHAYWSMLMLLQSRGPDVWRAAVAVDGIVVIEGPEGNVKAEALNLLLEAISNKLARCVKKSWVKKKRSGNNDSDDDSDVEAETGLEEDSLTGARFASERQRRSR